jgi:hypothetical protein
MTCCPATRSAWMDMAGGRRTSGHVGDVDGGEAGGRECRDAHCVYMRSETTHAHPRRTRTEECVDVGDVVDAIGRVEDGGGHERDAEAEDKVQPVERQRRGRARPEFADAHRVGRVRGAKRTRSPASVIGRAQKTRREKAGVIATARDRENVWPEKRSDVTRPRPGLGPGALVAPVFSVSPTMASASEPMRSTAFQSNSPF